MEAIERLSQNQPAREAGFLLPGNPMNPPDFEALGRYVHASECVASLHEKRNSLANEMGRLLKNANLNISSDTVSMFDHAKFIQQAEELANINVQLESAIADMNAHAAAANRKTLRRV